MSFQTSKYTYVPFCRCPWVHTTPLSLPGTLKTLPPPPLGASLCVVLTAHQTLLWLNPCVWSNHPLAEPLCVVKITLWLNPCLW